MAKSFLLEIVTPERLFFAGEAEIVIVRTFSGEEGFMAGHSWACKMLDTGELWLREADSKECKLAAISGGFIDVRDDVLIFTDEAEWQDEIDVDRAEEADKREKEWLEKYSSEAKEQDKEHDKFEEAEFETHRLAMLRALNRKKVAFGGRRGRH